MKTKSNRFERGKQIATLVGALTAGAAGIAYAEGVQELEKPFNYYQPEKQTTITLPNEKQPQKIASRVFPSERPGYEEVKFSYDFYDDFTFCESNNPTTRFSLRSFYDVDNDKNWGLKEQKMVEAGIPMYMGNNFDETVRSVYTTLFADYQRKIENSGKLDKPKLAMALAEANRIEREYHTNVIRRANSGYSAQSEEEKLAELAKRAPRSVNTMEMDLPKVPEREVATVYEEGNPLGQKVIVTQKKPAEKNKIHVPLELVVGGRASIPVSILKNESYVQKFTLANGLYGGELGLKVGKYFGFTGNISTRANRNVLDIRELLDETMFPGIYGIAKGDFTNFLSLGTSLDGYIPFSDLFSWVISLGLNRESYIQRVEKRIEGPSGQIGIPEVDSPKDKSQIYAAIGMGPSIKVTDRVRLSLIGGAQVPIKEDDASWAVNWKETAPYLDVRASFYLNK